jgi:phosphate transport system permease protein
MWCASTVNKLNESNAIPRPSPEGRPGDTMAIVRRSLARRKRAERRFRLYGLSAILLALGFLSVLFVSIVGNGYTAFFETYVELDIYFDPQVIDPSGERDRQILSRADYGFLVKRSVSSLFPEVTQRRAKRELYGLVSTGADFILRKMVLADPALIGQVKQVWVPADDDIDMLMKGHIDRAAPEEDRRLNDQVIAWVDRLIEDGRIEKRFNTTFFTSGDSREPELAGIWGAAVGSFFTLIVTLALSFPIGVSAAVYLEEFAPTNRWTDLIEVNINNLAAVPSIVFGLLGLAVFINFFGLPRSAPLVGGLVLTLMTLPTIIIASRAALKSVPPSIREAALGVGASKMQTIFHHVLPLAMPGMLTGTIIGMAQALGETAPLLMIGMVAFIVDIPTGVFDPSTVLPVQIYLWADSPERAFVERTSAAIMVLLAFLIAMNALAVILRKRFERRW